MVAYWTQAGNSLRQTVHTHRVSVHQAAKLVAALLRVAGVTAGLAKSNGSLPPGLWLTSPAGWLPRTGISSATLRWVIEYGLPLPFLNFNPCLSGPLSKRPRWLEYSITCYARARPWILPLPPAHRNVICRASFVPYLVGQLQKQSWVDVSLIRANVSRREIKTMVINGCCYDSYPADTLHFVSLACEIFSRTLDS